MHRTMSVALLLASGAVILASVMADVWVVGVLGILIAFLSIVLLMLSLLDTTPSLLAAAFVQQERHLGTTALLVEHASDAESREDEPLAMSGFGAEEPVGTDATSEEGRYRDGMARRGHDIRRRLSSVAPPSGSSASEPVTGVATRQTRRAEEAYATAMSAIAKRFEAGSLSWQRFASGARAGYEKVLDNCETVASCLESLDMSGHDDTWHQGDHGGRVGSSDSVPSPACEPAHVAISGLIRASDVVLDGMTHLACDLTGIMADEATDGTRDVAEHIQTLVHDVPEYRAGA